MKRKKFTLENVLVTDYAAGGKSLARIDGKVIFIEGAVPGDTVDVFVSTNKKDWGEGRAIRFRGFAPNRIPAFCQHFGTCGGCKWQMLPYHLQLAYKQQEVEQHFRRIGKVDLPPILPIVGASQTTAYRNKLEFTFSNKKYLTDAEIKELPPPDRSTTQPLPTEATAPVPSDGFVAGTGALGFHVPRIFDKVIEIDECYLMDPVNNAIRNNIRQFARQQGWSFYDIKAHTGWLRNIVIRHCSTGDLMVNIILGFEAVTERKQLLDYLLETVPQITTLLYTINPKWNDTIYDLEPQTYFGKGYAEEVLDGYRFKVGPKSFFQTNTAQATQLYRITKEFAGLTGHEVVYDLYCGTGSIGIFVSDKARKIIGVEVVEAAIVDAKENAALNGITHAEFFAGDVIKICDDEFFAQHGRPDVVITDPPRAGMHEKLVQKLLDMAAPKIVYVSCNTATQARDLALLAEKYELLKIQPVDMFPHTHHIECVVLLGLKSQVGVE